MTERAEEFNAVPVPDGSTLEPCPLCASDAAIWRRSSGPDSKTHVAVCCSRTEPIGPQEGALIEGCPMYFPGEEFYRNRIADAVKFWNEFAIAAAVLQRNNRWARAQVLRSDPSEG